jgi:uncharacterized protein YjlB
MVSGDGHLPESDKEESRRRLAKVRVDGHFMMMGAYPVGSDWDWSVGGDHAGRFEEVWSVPRPERDPVLGVSEEGLCGLWREREGDRSRL